MSVSIRNVLLALYVTTLVACGGGSSSQSDSTSQQSPSAAVQPNEQASQDDFSKEEALAAVSVQARDKIATDFLDRVFNESTSYVIVEFFYNDVLTNPPTPIAVHEKEEVKALLSPDYSVIREYRHFPLSYVQVRSRRTLVRLLNNDYVKRVTENGIYFYMDGEDITWVEGK